MEAKIEMDLLIANNLSTSFIIRIFSYIVIKEASNMLIPATYWTRFVYNNTNIVLIILKRTSAQKSNKNDFFSARLKN